MNEGTPIAPPTRPSAIPEGPPPVTSKRAAWSLVCAFLGFGLLVAAGAVLGALSHVMAGIVIGAASLGLAGLAGVILGISALVGISRSEGRLRGNGLAACGICLAAVCLALSPVAVMMGLVMVPVVKSAQRTALGAVTIAHANRAASGVVALAATEGTLTLEAWADLEDRPEIPFLDDDTTTPRHLALNEALVGLDLATIDNADEVVLLFEVDSDAPLSGGEDLLPEKPAAGDGYVIVFANSSSMHVPLEEVADLVWEPDEVEPGEER